MNVILGISAATGIGIGPAFVLPEEKERIIPHHAISKEDVAKEWKRFDDAVETFMMSLLFEGRISCFRPVTFLDRSGVTQIRPLVYAGEKKIANLAAELQLPIVENPCPEDKTSKRYEIKKLLAQMSQDYPDLKSKIFGAMQRMPLPGWGITG